VTKDIKLSYMIQLFCPKYGVCFFIPFLLFHKVGITRDLHGLIVSHANAGLAISEIQTPWLQTMYDAYGLRRAAHLSACTANSKLCTSYPEFERKLISKSWRKGDSLLYCWELLEKGTFVYQGNVSNDCQKFLQILVSG